MIEKIKKDKYLKLLKNYKKLNKEYKKILKDNEIKDKLITELRALNYEISYNNIDLIEQRKKYQKKNKLLREEIIELKNKMPKEEQTWKQKK